MSGWERLVDDLPRLAGNYSSALIGAHNEANLAAIQVWEMYEGFEFLTGEDFHWLNAIDILES